MATIPQPRFYVYTLARPDGSIFYVGKGKGARMAHHENEARRGKCRCKRCNTIRKIWSAGGQVVSTIVFRTNDEPEAFTYERELIAQYGRENLCNWTEGGEGAADPDPEVLARKSAAMKAAWENADHRTRVRESVQAAYADPELRARISAAVSAAKSTPEARAKIGATAKIANNTPEARARAGAASQRAWDDPEQRAQRIADMTSPEGRAKNSAGTKAAWDDPEHRARMLSIHTSPETRARHSAASKAAWAKRKANKK